MLVELHNFLSHIGDSFVSELSELSSYRTENPLSYRFDLSFSVFCHKDNGIVAESDIRSVLPSDFFGDSYDQCLCAGLLLVGARRKRFLDSDHDSISDRRCLSVRSFQYPEYLSFFRSRIISYDDV